ncbi:MAG TPA: DUF2202 domain-containing protein [Nocardioidaceae bacterium]|nr:DUF2202 domain-containing protein [Nocardioidaceae bacterium]
MRTRRIVAVALAAGVVGAGAVVTPMVLAADDDPAPYGPRWDQDGDGGPGWMQERMQGRMQGRGMGPGAGMGPGMMQAGGMGPGAGQGMRGAGDCLFADAAKGTLTDAQKQTLADQAEKEKLSHDVYVAYFESTGDYRFERIAESEDQHLEALRNLMDRYDVTDPTEGLDEGEFRSDTVDSAYDAYLDEGDELGTALKAAQAIEEKDIAGLEKAAKGIDAPDAEQVYEHLTRASEMHLQAFSR